MREAATITERMARREARALLLVPPSIPAPPGVLDPQVTLRSVTCPWCGARPEPPGAQPGEPPVVRRRVRPEPPDDRPVVTILACETLANRALLPVLATAPGHYLSRGVFVARRPSAGNVSELLTALDAAESWADPGRRAPSGLDAVVPASTRMANEVPSHFLSPHAELDDLNTLYARVRYAAVRAGL
ncbi:hypothetical protein E1292_06800 [Nonomuraea deserti]|uniref:Uncharacterized protein n=1 Tax=Nonomuraea deserti TaxID=1848322 RepID=A0A4V2YCD5_9ACTN|nr:hypothetical protein [Nonomuraea deserti]TDD11066.1 hypothetical protein E1292_06800 [Nonomuraea deserti]